MDAVTNEGGIVSRLDAAQAGDASLLDPANAKALEMLDAALKRQQAAVSHYVAPPCPGTAPAVH